MSCCSLFLRYDIFHLEEFEALGLHDWEFSSRIEEVVATGSVVVAGIELSGDTPDDILSGLVNLFLSPVEQCDF